jgi:hypothetical protein
MTSLLKATENECSVGGELFQKRAQLIEVLNKMGAQTSPQDVCSKITPLVQNGTSLLKWMKKEKEWCKIPDDLIERLTNDHTQSSKIQKQSCDAAKSMNLRSKNANLSDGHESISHDDKSKLTSPMTIPQGINLK